MDNRTHPTFVEQNSNKLKTKDMDNELMYAAGELPHNQGQIYASNGQTLAVTYNDPEGRRAKMFAASYKLFNACTVAERLLSNSDIECKRELRLIMDAINDAF